MLYLRQSKARDDSISLEIQEAQARAHCARQGYAVQEPPIVDEGVSGYRDWRRRPAFPQVFEVDAEVVVVYRWSRLSRRRLDQVQIISDLEAKGRRVESAVEPTDPSTAGGRLARDQMLLIAAFESDVKSEQWKEALARRHSRGLPKNGLLRYGYLSQGKGLPLAPDPDTAPVLRELYLRYAAGAGFQSLVSDLNSRGVRTRRGGEWQVHSLVRMLDSGFGAGLLIESSTGRHHRGAHEPVITPDEWTAYLDARQLRRAVPTKARSPRWALSSIARCGLCGSPLTVTTYDSPKSQVRCTGYVNRRTCSGVWMNRRTLENLVEFFLVGWQADALSAVLTAERTEQATAAQSTAERLEADLTGVQAALGRLATRYARDLIDDDAYSAAQADLTRDRDRLAGELVTARAEVNRLRPVQDPLRDPGSLTPGEFGQAVGRVLRRFEVTKKTVRFVPVVGEATVWER